MISQSPTWPESWHHSPFAKESFQWNRGILLQDDVGFFFEMTIKIHFHYNFSSPCIENENIIDLGISVFKGKIAVLMKRYKCQG